MQMAMELDFELDIKVTKGIKSDQKTHDYTLKSNLQNSRATSYMMKFLDGKLALYPIDKVLTLQNKYSDKTDGENLMPLKEPEGEKKKENLRQVESHMRKYNFQKELLGREEWVNYQFIGPDMPVHKRFMETLLEDSKNPKSVFK